MERALRCELRLVLLTVSASLLVSCSGLGPAAPRQETKAPDGELLATYYPTPDLVVDRMLALADPHEGELHYDLGSGDGRIVIAAAQRYGTHSIGFEIDPDLVKISRNRIRRLHLEDRAEIEARDLLTADLGAADVITTFLTPEAFEKLTPLLERQLRPGVRVVSYKFPVPGWTPDKTVTLKDADPDIPDHEIFLYKR